MLSVGVTVIQLIKSVVNILQMLLNIISQRYLTIFVHHSIASYWSILQVEVFHDLPEIWILRLANKHNDNNDFRRKTTFIDRVVTLRGVFEESSTWTIEGKKKALEKIGFRNPSTNTLKSNNELFQFTGVSDQVWQKFQQLMKGDYLAHKKEVLYSHSLSTSIL